jgi:hypothetical protein
MWQHLSSLDKSCILMHTSKAVDSNPYRSAISGEEVIDNALVFASDAKGPCRDCQACGRWYSDRRVLCLILSHSKFEKGQTALKAPADE